jgi:hypothetical protein
MRFRWRASKRVCLITHEISLGLRVHDFSWGSLGLALSSVDEECFPSIDFWANFQILLGLHFSRRKTGNTKMFAILIYDRSVPLLRCDFVLLSVVKE